MLLDTAINLYIQHLELKESAKETIRGYRILLCEFMRYTESNHNGAVLITDITCADVERFLAFRKSVGDMPSTRNRHFYILNTFFKFLVVREVIEKNIMSVLVPIKINHKERQYLELEQVHALIDAIEPPILKIAVTTLAYTGLRVSELCNLKDTDVDLEKRVIKVISGKGNKDRIVPISERLYKVLLDYTNNLKPAKLTNYFFATHKNPKITDDYINRVIKIAALKVGLDFKPTAHTLRHSFASALVQNDAPLPSIQRILGHADLRITSRYIHQSFSQIKDAVDLI